MKALPLAIMLSTSAHAFQFEFEPGSKWSASLDSTITYGAMWRLEGASADLTADANRDDANNNFGSGLVSNSIRMISDFELRYTLDSGDSYGVFARGSAYYDDEVQSDTTNDNPYPLLTANGPVNTVNSAQMWGGTLASENAFHKDTVDRIGRGKELLDLFVFAELAQASNHPVSLRVGSQVVNWGESAFIQNGVSAAINPADANKAVLPGTEVKEILRPLGAVYGSVALTENISLQAYIQYEWEESISPAYGSYLSAAPDFASVDGSEQFLAAAEGLVSPIGVPFLSEAAGFSDFASFAAAAGAAGLPPITTVSRVADVEADDDGQWGVALSWYVPELNDTEFGFYVVNYHRKLASFEFIGGDGSASAYTDACVADLPGLGCAVNNLAGAPTGAPAPAPANTPGLAPIMDAISATDYRMTYQEDVELYAFSWNTVIPVSETAVSGEIGYHKDIPVQTTPALTQALGSATWFATGAPRSGDWSTLHDMIVTQVTFNQDLNFVTFADDAMAIVEFGWVHTSGLEDGNVSPTGVVTGSWAGMTPASRDSWGYQAAFTLTWYDGLGRLLPAMSGTDLIATLNLRHDVDGNSPIPGTGFSENNKAATIGVEAIWQNTWSAQVTYTNFWGSSTDTLGQKVDDAVLGDRDNIALNVKYRF
jgi:hypothetical protein